jgi:hypothetical protein
MEAPPPIVDTSLPALRERLANDLDSTLDFDTDAEARAFLSHCDESIHAIRRECIRVRPHGEEREEIVDFLRRAGEHLEPLR